MKKKISLLEMFGTRADIKWTSTSTGEIGTFELEEQKFEIIYNEYDPIILSTKNSSGSLVEIGFSRIKNNKPIIKLTNDRDSIKVFSIIFNGILEKFQKVGYPTTLFFSAKRGEEYDGRKSLYSRLQDRICKFGYDKVELIENDKGTHFILTKTKLNDKEFLEIRNLILEM